jgi:hypothetical protein
MDLAEDGARNEAGGKHGGCGVERNILRDSDEVAFAHNTLEPGTNTGLSHRNTVAGRKANNLGANGIHRGDGLNTERAEAKGTHSQADVTDAGAGSAVAHPCRPRRAGGLISRAGLFHNTDLFHR